MAAVNERETRCAVLTFAFLHGGGQGSWVWDETIAALSLQTGGTVHCLALDAPGCGPKRGADASDYAFADTTRELIADRLHARRMARIDAGHQVMNIRPQALAEVLLLEAAAAG